MDHFQHGKAIVAKLAKAGFIAYFAGGWVRDFVMGSPSEDIDIATNASPAQIMDLFPHTILVGLAFGVVIVVHEGHQFEIATFRKDLPYEDGRRPQGITLSSPQEDAARRDFTINGMFYDPLEEVLHDYVHGREDIHQRVIRTIGDPSERFYEDRLRMVRAFRFAARFEFKIDPETQEAIREHSDKLFPAVAMERIKQEFNKMAAYPRFDEALVEMHRLELLDVIFPDLAGMHIKELRQIVAHFKHFPPRTSGIIYLMELFPHHTLSQKLDIARRLRASNEEIKFLEYLETLTALVKQEQAGNAIEAYQWAVCAAHPAFKNALHVIVARQPDLEREAFLQQHLLRAEALFPHIQRIQTQSPLISSNHLRQRGVLPGKRMGDMLKEAERMAVNENWSESGPLLEKLSSLPHWKQTP